MLNLDQKKTYNKEYYTKNKDQVLERARARYKARSPKVVPLFGQKKKASIPTKPPGKKQRRGCRAGTLLLCLLSAAMTFYLISEMAHFYALSEKGMAGAYFRALLLEGAVLTFSLLKGPTPTLRLAYRFMVVLIYGYSIWVASGTVVQTTVEQSSLISRLGRSTVELESELERKIALRSTLLAANRVTMGAKIDQVIDGLRSQLSKVRLEQSALPVAATLWSTLFTLVCFRVLTMLSNLLILQELKRRYGLKN